MLDPRQNRGKALQLFGGARVCVHIVPAVNKLLGRETNGPLDSHQGVNKFKGPDPKFANQTWKNDQFCSRRCKTIHVFLGQQPGSSQRSSGNSTNTQRKTTIQHKHSFTCGHVQVCTTRSLFSYSIYRYERMCNITKLCDPFYRCRWQDQEPGPSNLKRPVILHHRLQNISCSHSHLSCF